VKRSVLNDPVEEADLMVPRPVTRRGALELGLFVFRTYQSKMAPRVYRVFTLSAPTLFPLSDCDCTETALRDAFLFSSPYQDSFVPFVVRNGWQNVFDVDRTPLAIREVDHSPVQFLRGENDAKPTPNFGNPAYLGLNPV
jgi:hypothetical protein